MRINFEGVRSDYREERKGIQKCKVPQNGVKDVDFRVLRRAEWAGVHNAPSICILIPESHPRNAHRFASELVL